MSRWSTRTAAVVCAVLVAAWGSPELSLADSPSPEPSVTTTSPAPSETAATSPTQTTPTETPTTGPSPTPSTTPDPTTADPSPALTLSVTPVGGPVAAFYEDLGSYGFAGSTTLPDGTAVVVQRRGSTGTWATVATATAQAGAYAVRLGVQAAGPATFRAAAPGEEGGSVTSAPTTVTVRDATIALTSVPATVDSLKALPVAGAVVPARAGVVVKVEVRSGTTWRALPEVTTNAAGRYGASLSSDLGTLARYDVRASYGAVNRRRTETSATSTFERVAVLDAVTDDTTRADVAKTYRKGCPVGPSRLTTIHMNYYGRDKRMHRGVMIIRTDLRQEIIRAFGSALKHRYPIAKMNNPNAYGGNDPKQMKADNTSGFNCRKVVGNPYKMSPHSYGIALDVNTVQNPYRDVHGTWWPSNGKKYRDRSPLRWGMLGTKSWLTKSLRSDHFFWGGRWNPGRDYQHFEYRG